MRSKSKCGRGMITAEQALEQIRPDLARIISAKEQKLGSRMLAYDRLGADLGRSPSWIRKVLGRAPDVTVGLHDALNIRAAYERICARVSAAADAQAAENNRLRRDIHAALQGDRPAAARTPGGAPAAGAAPRRPGRPTAPALVVPDARPRVPGLPGAGDLTDLPLWRASNEEE